MQYKLRICASDTERWSADSCAQRSSHGRCCRQKTGYGSYGPPAGWLRGARVVQLQLGEAPQWAASWIRMEDGTVVEQTESAVQSGPDTDPAQTVCNAGADFCEAHSGAASCRAEL
jgi:hypothetical protein